jgi:hypothetical protein
MRLRAGVRAGLVAAAATAGAIIGFGIRHNDWLGPFASLGQQMLQSFGVAAPTRFLTSVTGLVVHASWMLVWGVTFAALAHRRSPAAAALLAVLIAVGAMFISRLIPAAFGALRFAALPGVQAALYLALIAAGFVTGRALSAGD